jgi:acetoin utilization deacetylase AcuC-like enzyme
LKVFYSDKYTFPLTEGHRFPIVKYRMLREMLIAGKVLSKDELSEPPMATREQITLAHTEKYHDDFRDGKIGNAMIRRLGLPWSYELYLRSAYSVGGAIASALAALKEGIAGNLAGGTHHAFRDAAEGFCVFNDSAVVANYLQQNDLANRLAIIDLDVHQGNGNSAMLGDNRNVFIFSMHGKKNYPFRKIPSTLDIELNDGTDDDEYLNLLKSNLPAVFDFNPDIVLYIHGVDTLKEDTLGRLSMTKSGLMERDRIVMKECRKRNIPLSLGLGGGYAKPIEHSVEAYCGTYVAAKEVFAQ